MTIETCLVTVTPLAAVANEPVVTGALVRGVRFVVPDGNTRRVVKARIIDTRTWRFCVNNKHSTTSTVDRYGKGANVSTIQLTTNYRSIDAQ